jgi:hypothetical protein
MKGREREREREREMSIVLVEMSDSWREKMI